MKPTDLERRKFFKAGAFALASALLLPVLGGRRMIDLASAEDKLPLLSESDPMAVSLGYKHDAKKVDVKKFPKRADAEGKKQFCENCMFYTGTGKDQGKCQIFVGKEVKAKGWCNSWSKKPG